MCPFDPSTVTDLSRESGVCQVECPFRGLTDVLFGSSVSVAEGVDFIGR